MEETAAPQAPEAAPKSAADAMAARREARRKRILENSNNRLTKITGREHNEPPAEDFTVSPPETIYPDPEDERDVYQQPAATVAAAAAMNSPNGDIFSLLNTLNQANANGSIGSAGGQPVPTPTSLAPDTTLVKFLRTRLHIALMAIAVYLVFATGRQHWLGGSVFVALLAWETAELCLIQPFPSQPSFLDVVFLLSGLNSRSGQFVMRIVRTTHRVLRDVALFMFCFVVSHLLWSCLVLDIDLSYVLNYHQLLEAAPEGTAAVA